MILLLYKYAPLKNYIKLPTPFYFPFFQIPKSEPASDDEDVLIVDVDIDLASQDDRVPENDEDSSQPIEERATPIPGHSLSDLSLATSEEQTDKDEDLEVNKCSEETDSPAETNNEAHTQVRSMQFLPAAQRPGLNSVKYFETLELHQTSYQFNFFFKL